MRNWLVVLVLATGCGDNSRSCGVGTVVEQGFCVPTTECGFGTKADDETGVCVPDGTVVCSNGTKFDPLTGSCQLDPAACQNGTVLIDAMCVDPALGTVADLNEGPEPNGLDVIESSLVRAGNVLLRAPGDPAYVIHGTIDPFEDVDGDGALDPDVDTYVLVVNGPTLIGVTADGVHGVNAGFLVTSAMTLLDATWQRFGIDLSSDTSQRQVFLPSAGVYYLSVADTRTLFEYADSGTAHAAPGDADGDYYVSIANVAPPAPTPIAIGDTASGTLAAGDVALYQATFANGSHAVTLAMPSVFAVASVVVGGHVDDEDSDPARVVAPGGLGTKLIVVDYVYDVSPSPVSYQLSIQ